LRHNWNNNRGLSLLVLQQPLANHKSYEAQSDFQWVSNQIHNNPLIASLLFANDNFSDESLELMAAGLSNLVVMNELSLGLSL